MTRKSNAEEKRTEKIQSALLELNIARNKYLRIIEIRLEQGANQPGMGNLLDPAIDDLHVVSRAMKDAEKLLSKLEKE